MNSRPDHLFSDLLHYIDKLKNLRHIIKSIFGIRFVFLVITLRSYILNLKKEYEKHKNHS